MKDYRIKSDYKEVVYKGVPLESWNNLEKLGTLTDSELIELYALMYCDLLDCIEYVVEKSPMLEAILVIGRIKQKAYGRN